MMTPLEEEAMRSVAYSAFLGCEGLLGAGQESQDKKPRDRKKTYEDEWSLQ
jgi:hypothetical protein